MAPTVNILACAGLNVNKASLLINATALQQLLPLVQEEPHTGSLSLSSRNSKAIHQHHAHSGGCVRTLKLPLRDPDGLQVVAR